MIAYHLALAALLALLISLFPTLPRHLPIGGVRDLASTADLTLSQSTQAPADSGPATSSASPPDPTNLDRLGYARRLAIALIGIWLLMLPVYWVHKGTYRGAEHDHSLDETTLILQAPWGAIERETSGRRHPAMLAYTDVAGEPVRIAATIEVRGITRLRHCEFPPLRLRFEPAAVAGTVFAGQRSLKMVTHCKKGGIYRRYTVLELLSYRIYQQITPLSFRVRPLEV